VTQNVPRQGRGERRTQPTTGLPPVTHCLVQTLPRKGRGERRAQPICGPQVVTPPKGQSLSPSDHRPVVG